ncbi:heterokaryon incompatibility protein-domain-containing protein, partial [Hyaloscypha finlandica]
QHAIDISRNLRLRYLWVDALCIIQDSDDDWKVEAAKMGSIYARSYLTIAADSARDASEGCFSIREELQVSFYESKGTVEGGRESVLYVPVDKVRNQPRQGERRQDPLSKRGWTLQERILSPRILHYTSHQIYWECRSRPRIEDEPITLLCESPLWWFPTPKTRGLVRCLNLNGTRDKVLSVCRKLSVSTDMLPAISGLARLVNSTINSEYLAGMWRDGLEWALLWFRTASENPPARSSSQRPEPEKYVAPSWSWASIASPVDWRLNIQYQYPDVLPRFAIEETAVKLAGDDPFGIVESCSLRIRGVVLNEWLRYTGSHEIEITVDDWVSSKVSLDYYNELPGPVSLLLLFGPLGGERHYLVLRKASETDNYYRRVGLLWSSFSDSKDRDYTHQTITII